MYATISGKLDIVKFMFESGIDKEQVDPRNDNNLLHLACISNNVDLVKFMLDQGFSVKDTSKGGVTPVHIAAGEGNIEVIEFLFSSSDEETVKMMPNLLTDNHYTPLHFALINLREPVAKFLLRHGARTTITTPSGKTACQLLGGITGSDELKSLIEEVRSAESEHYREDIIQAEEQMRLAALQEKLSQEEAKRKEEEESMRRAKEAMARQRQLEEERLEYERLNPPPHRKPSKKIKAVKLDYSFEESEDITLHEYTDAENIWINFKKNTKKNCRLPDEELKKRFENGEYFLHKLVCEHEDKYFKEFKRVLDLIGIDVVDHHYNTPLHTAIIKGEDKYVHYLLDKGADVNKYNRDGDTPIHIAIKLDRVNLLRTLSRNNAINVMTKDQITCVNLAILKNRWTALQELFRIERCIDVDTPDLEGNTPLHNSALLNYTNFYRFLIKQNADTRLANKLGNLATALYKEARRE